MKIKWACKDWISLTRFIYLVFSFVTLTAFQANAEEKNQKKTILILDAHSPQMTWARSFQDGFENVMISSGVPVTRHWEFLDAMRFKSHFSMDSFAKHVLEKYRNEKLDYVLAMGAASVKFLARNPEFFPDIPVLLVAGNSFELVDAQAVRKNSVSAALDASLTASFDYVLEHHKPRKIYVLGETQSEHVRLYLNELQAQRGTEHLGIEIEYLVDMPMDALKAKLSNSKEKEAAFYIGILRNTKGEYLSVKDYIFDLTDAANIPIFSHWATWVGKERPAIVGGLLMDPTNLGAVFADNMLSYLVENKPFDIEYMRASATRAIYDYRQLKRFGLLNDEMPSDVVILAKENAMGGLHQWILIGLPTSGLIAVFWIVAVRRQVAAKTRRLTVENQELSTISNTDALTGLPNRRRFDELIEHECARSGRMGQALAVAMIDIDRFKDYNDLYGHQQGDECLKDVAQAIQSYCHRAGDNCARYGGEEFALISVGNDIERAERRLERLRQAIEDLKLVHEQSKEGVVTISVGVAVVNGRYPYNSELLIAKADKALYEAKRLGRNRVVGFTYCANEPSCANQSS